MSCNYSVALGGSSYRTNTLGMRVACLPGAPKCSTDTENDAITCTSQSCMQREYEMGFLDGFVAPVTDGLGDEIDVTTIRVTKAGPHGFVIGVAYSVATGGLEGFLGNAAGVGPGHPLGIKPTCLRTVSSVSGEVYQLHTPRALLVLSQDQVVVVGSGTVYDLDGVAYLNGPAIANVCRNACGVLVAYVVVGNGPLSPEITNESYNDIHVDPVGFHGDTETWLVCGTGTLNGGSRCALLRRLSAVTYLPVFVHIPDDPTPPRPYAIINMTGSGYSPLSTVQTEAVSIATPGDMIVVGVNVYSTSLADAANPVGTCLWPLRFTLVQLLPWPSTAYNSPYTGLIVTPGLSTACLRVLAPRVSGSGGGGCGSAAVCDVGDVALYVVTLVRLDTGQGLPSHAVQVNAYTSDTAPQITFGSAGVLTWTASSYTSTRPNDAILTANGRDVLVVGNAFLGETTLTPVQEPLQHEYTVPGFPCLTVHATVPYVPAPFVIKVSYTGGCPCPVVTNLEGCAAVRWASGLSLSALPNAMLMLGDVTEKLRQPAQMPYVLSVALQYGKGGTRLLNCTRVPATSALQSHGCGLVVLPQQCVVCACACSDCSNGCVADADGVKAGCATTTTLVLPGPIVIGGTPSSSPTVPLPGSLRFDAASQTFQGYDGTAWRTLVTTALP